MMRVWTILAALALAAPASADNILMKNKGLGAAVLGGVAVDATSALLGEPEAWQGYPKDNGGLPFANDAAGLKLGGCLDREGGDVAKALMAQKDVPQKPAPEGVLRMTEAERQSAASAYDSKAMYQGGTNAGCQPN